MAAEKTLTALGLMSGTSMDGIDAALMSTNGRLIDGFGPSLVVPYSAEFRARLRGVLGGHGRIGAIEREITLLHVQAVENLLRQGGLAPADVDVIGFHGHTIMHDPENRRTRQIGQGRLLARRTGIDVVDDFRSRDVAAGGQGAPLAPLLHLALSRDLERPLAVLNLGGVANVTWIGAGHDGHPESGLMGFDTGPGNALIDDWVGARTGRAMDTDGALAGRGRVHEKLVENLLAHPFFHRPPPKSMDRDLLGSAPLAGIWAGLSTADGAATLSALTVRAIHLGADYFPAPVKGWLVCGGGRKNPALMGMLADLLEVPVRPVEAVGWDGDMLEAQAFAYLAVRSLRRLPISLPATTGVPAALTGGTLHRWETG